jgi:hypothetical protein
MTCRSLSCHTMADHTDAFIPSWHMARYDSKCRLQLAVTHQQLLPRPYNCELSKWVKHTKVPGHHAAKDKPLFMH